MRTSESIRDECIHTIFVHLSSFLSMSHLRARLETNVLKRTRHVYVTENLERGSSWKEDEGPAIGSKEWKRGKQAGQIRESRKRGDCNLRRSLLQNETSDWRGRVFVRSTQGKKYRRLHAILLMSASLWSGKNAILAAFILYSCALEKSITQQYCKHPSRSDIKASCICD